MSAVSVALLVTGAVAFADLLDAHRARRRTVARVRALRGEPGTAARTAPGPPPPRAPGGPLRAFGAVGAACAAAVLFGAGGPFLGGATAVAAGALAWTVLGRLEPAARRRAARQIAAEVPGAADLVAAALAAGAPVDQALRTAGTAVGGDVGEAFVRAAAALALGSSPAEVFARWSTDPLFAPLEPFGRSLTRGLTGGSALVPVITRFADELRTSRRHEAEAIARKVAVRATAPLGLCFLPAFVLLGIVPAILAGARTLGL